MATTTEKLIPLAEVTNRVAVYWLDKVGARIVEDWAGQPTVREADASKAFKLQEAAEADNTRRHAVLRQRLLEHAENRRAAGDAAVQRARPQLLARQQRELQDSDIFWSADTLGAAGHRATSATRAALAQVRSEAEAAFDEKHPEPTLEDR